MPQRQIALRIAVRVVQPRRTGKLSREAEEMLFRNAVHAGCVRGERRFGEGALFRNQLLANPRSLIQKVVRRAPGGGGAGGIRCGSVDLIPLGCDVRIIADEEAGAAPRPQPAFIGKQAVYIKHSVHGNAKFLCHDAKARKAGSGEQTFFSDEISDAATELFPQWMRSIQPDE